MLTIDNLTVKYGKNVILRDLSLRINNGTIIGIIGYNGAGKTTLLNAIYGIIDAPREKFKYNNEVLARPQITYLEATNFFYSHITGRDYLKLFSKRNSKFNIELWQSIMNLPLDEFIETYSTGMRKKLALLGVLSLDKEILILDEPFNGLDLESVTILQLICKQLVAKQKTIIVTSHVIETLTSICDSISILENGVITSSFGSHEFDIMTKNINEQLSGKYTALISEGLTY